MNDEIEFLTNYPVVYVPNDIREIMNREMGSIWYTVYAVAPAFLACDVVRYGGETPKRCYEVSLKQRTPLFGNITYPSPSAMDKGKYTNTFFVDYAYKTIEECKACVEELNKKEKEKLLAKYSDPEQRKFAAELFDYNVSSAQAKYLPEAADTEDED